MPTKEVDVLFNLQQTGGGAKETVSNLKSIEQQAEKTKQKMRQLSEVGLKLGVAGAAILAPFALAMKKYTDTVKDAEPVSKRILELNKKWEDSQVRLGRVTATILLPALEQGAALLEQIISFAEKNPDVVRAALTVGATLVILGGLITTTAQIVSTISTVVGLASSVGIALGGGGAAAGAAAGGAELGAAATAAVGGSLTADGIGLAVGTSVATIAVPVLIAGLFTVALVLAANLGLVIGNALGGTNQTWGDIGATLQNILIIDALAADNIVRFFGGSSNFEGTMSNVLGVSDRAVADSNMRIAQTSTSTLGGFFLNGIGLLFMPLQHIGDIIAGLANLFGGGHAEGGYVGAGIHRLGENGREFVMSNQTTRNAERAIGGRLTQDRATTMMTNNYNMGRNTVRQTRQIVREEMKSFKDGVMSW